MEEKRPTPAQLPPIMHTFYPLYQILSVIAWKSSFKNICLPPWLFRFYLVASFSQRHSLSAGWNYSVGTNTALGCCLAFIKLQKRICPTYDVFLKCKYHESLSCTHYSLEVHAHVCICSQVKIFHLQWWHFVKVALDIKDIISQTHLQKHSTRNTLIALWCFRPKAFITPLFWQIPN